MRRIILTTAVILGLAAVCSGPPAHATPQSHVICIVFEDDSFTCGTPAPGGWLDRTHPWISGCIPEGLCDDAFRDDPTAP